MILITHDLGVVAEMADRVAVMYAGEIVEQAEVRPLFRDPKHPYTKGLIGSIPTLGVIKEELETIPGVVPSLMDLPPGCRFASRCKARIEHGLEICLEVRPAAAAGGGGPPGAVLDLSQRRRKLEDRGPRCLTSGSQVGRDRRRPEPRDVGT